MGLPVTDLIVAVSDQTNILIAEEAIGGIAESLAWQLSKEISGAKIAIADLGKEYVTHGDMGTLYKQYGLDAESLAEKFMEVRKVEK